jgi:hypothetical protein
MHCLPCRPTAAWISSTRAHAPEGDRKRLPWCGDTGAGLFAFAQRIPSDAPATPSTRHVGRMTQHPAKGSVRQDRKRPIKNNLSSFHVRVGPIC